MTIYATSAITLIFSALQEQREGVGWRGSHCLCTEQLIELSLTRSPHELIKAQVCCPLVACEHVIPSAPRESPCLHLASFFQSHARYHFITEAILDHLSQGCPFCYVLLYSAILFPSDLFTIYKYGLICLFVYRHFYTDGCSSLYFHFRDIRDIFFCSHSVLRSNIMPDI